MNIHTSISTTISTTMKTITKTAMNATQEVARVGAMSASIAAGMVKRARGVGMPKGMCIDASAITGGPDKTNEVVVMSFEERMMDAASAADMQDDMSAELLSTALDADATVDAGNVVEDTTFNEGSGTEIGEGVSEDAAAANESTTEADTDQQKI